MMYKKIIFALAFIAAPIYGRTEYRPTENTIDTTGNTVDIQADDHCRFDAKKNIINCISGKEFAEPRQVTSAKTGTPAKKKNYIGTMVTEPSTPGKPGSGKRVDFFCKGECD